MFKTKQKCNIRKTKIMYSNEQQLLLSFRHLTWYMYVISQLWFLLKRKHKKYKKEYFLTLIRFYFWIQTELQISNWAVFLAICILVNLVPALLYDDIWLYWFIIYHQIEPPVIAMDVYCIRKAGSQISTCAITSTNSTTMYEIRIQNYVLSKYTTLY